MRFQRLPLGFLLTAVAACMAAVAACGSTPASDSANACSTSSQCQGSGGPGGHCQTVGVDDRGCGGVADVVTSTCAADTDCADAGAGEVCVLDPCARMYGSDDAPGLSRCQVGCTGATECESGELCHSGHCVAPSCAADSDCDANFACTAGECVRRSCTTDSQCASYCVDLLCASTPGECVPDAG